MAGIPAVRHSDTWQTSPLGTFIYRLRHHFNKLLVIMQAWMHACIETQKTESVRRPAVNH